MTTSLMSIIFFKKAFILLCNKSRTSTKKILSLYNNQNLILNSSNKIGKNKNSFIDANRLWVPLLCRDRDISLSSSKITNIKKMNNNSKCLMTSHDMVNEEASSYNPFNTILSYSCYNKNRKCLWIKSTRTFNC